MLVDIYKFQTFDIHTCIHFIFDMYVLRFSRKISKRYKCVCAFAFVCMCVCSYMWCVCVRISMDVRICIVCVYTYVYEFMCTYMYTHVYLLCDASEGTDVCIYDLILCVFGCLLAQFFNLLCIYIYIYIYIYICIDR